MSWDKSQHNVAYQYGIPNGKLPELGQPIRLCRTSEGYLAVLTLLVESPKPNLFVQPILTAYHFRNKDNLSNPTLDFEYFSFKSSSISSKIHYIPLSKIDKES